ncbi:hypothetical protein SLS58_008513 [Diplodia intermedia]|uniref:Uncharacterized protein n=1 Tax=Diplodia intermedia TaxID=856260 RepID=A0ABR3TH08_9PEZI
MASRLHKKLNPSNDIEVEASGRFTKFQQFSEHNVNRILNKRLKRAAEEDEQFQDEKLQRKMLKVFREVQSEVNEQLHKLQQVRDSRNQTPLIEIRKWWLRHQSCIPSKLCFKVLTRLKHGQKNLVSLYRL